MLHWDAMDVAYHDSTRFPLNAFKVFGHRARFSAFYILYRTVFRVYHYSYSELAVTIETIHVNCLGAEVHGKYIYLIDTFSPIRIENSTAL